MPQRITLDSGQRRSTIVQRLDAAVLVVQCASVSRPKRIVNAVDKAADLLEKGVAAAAGPRLARRVCRDVPDPAARGAVCLVINGLRGQLVSPRRGSVMR